MTECSQEFEDLLVKHEEECFDDWVLNIRSPGCADAKAAILQYVAELEVERDGLRARLDSALAGCSQEFKDMLAGYRDSVYLDRNKDSYVYSDATECAGDSILQYVAQLEAATGSLVQQGKAASLFINMTGGMP